MHRKANRHAQKGEQKNAFNERREYRVTCYVKRFVNMWTVCAQPDGSMSSLLQSTGSSPYVHVHIVGPLAAAVCIHAHLESGEPLCGAAGYLEMLCAPCCFQMWERRRCYCKEWHLWHLHPSLGVSTNLEKFIVAKSINRTPFSLRST